MITSRQFAQESEKTKKLRKKLREQLRSLDEKVTQQALDRKLHEIHHWISRHAVNRIPLKNKSISLFDENQNTAKVSQKVVNFVKKLDLQLQNLEVRNIGVSQAFDQQTRS